ncbi:helix-turn-helix domain-containing protein [Streptomyces sp. NPDC005813]|uniref:helix-turn-helix domain-containing protein n=1 Tax=Streptomyces sp. NPDC005813 TaxID=3155592 RepID=UPI0033FCDB07
MTTATVRGPLTRSELLALPAAVDVETAARAFGIGRTTAYALAKADEFPCRVLRAGKAYRVITQDLLRVLGIAPENSDGPGSSHPEPSGENSLIHQR